MRSTIKHMHFFTWSFIALFITVGSGFYFWSEKKYETQAGAQMSSPTVSDNTLTTGLLGHWTFDRSKVVWADTTTEIKNSVSTNHGNALGSLAAGSLTLGKQGQALTFNGTSDYVSAGDLDVTGDITLSAWIYPTSKNFVYQGIISKIVNFDYGNYTLVFKSMGVGATENGIYFRFEGGSVHQTDSTIHSMPLNVWYHTVATFKNSTNTVKIYVNGAEWYSNSSETASMSTNDNDVLIGQMTPAYSEYFSGKIDDIRVYNRALTASEIYQLYTVGTATVNTPVDDPLSQSLRGYWKMDEGTGTSTTADASGNANTLSMTGPPTWTTGTIGPSAMDFSGSGQYLSVADPASGVLDIEDGASFSITGWFNRDTFAADHTIVAKKTDQTTNAGYVIWIDNNGGTDYLNFEISDGTDTYSVAGATNMSATGWHNFTAVWQENKGMSLYLDGRLDGSEAASTTSIGSLANANAFRIGAESDAGVPFDGKIDDIRVYGYPLSAGDVLKLYQTTAPAQPVDTSLVGHWTFDGPDIQGTTAIDRSSFGNNGTLTGTTKTIGKLGQALSFNGSEDITISDPASGVLDFGASQAFSVSFWMNADSTSLAGILSKAASDVSQGYMLLHENGDFQFHLNDATDDCGWSSGGTLIFAGRWMHVVWTVTGSRQSSLYLDGVVNDTNTCSSVESLANSDDFSIGSAYSGVWEPFNGDMDDVRVYNRVLTEAEILNLYTIGR